jgi:hypothetical protein
MSHFWSRWLEGGSRRRQPGATRRQLFRTRPMLELLEDRLSPAVFNVNSLQDLSLAPGVNPDGTIVGTSTVTLRSAIQAANMTTGGNTINLTLPGTYQISLAPTTPNESDNQAGELAILPTGNLTIQNTSGGTATVSGGGQSRVFDVNPADTTNPTTAFLVTMQGFTITNGKAFDATGANPDGPVATGGGIRDQGNQSLTLTNIVITRNTATADGGGIVMANTVNSDWTLTLNATTISNNHAGDAGGGIDTDGAGTVVINTGSVISGNTDLNQGAGIYVDAIQVGTLFVGAPMTMTGSIVSNNQALAAGTLGPPASGGSGGGISNAGNGAITITNCTVSNNFAAGTGGGFSDENGQGTLTVTNSVFAGNTANGQGGGIQEGGPGLTITDSSFDNNSSGTSGGAVFFSGTTLTVQGSTFVNDTAIVNGGGLEVQATGTGSAITNSTIAGNSTLGNAGGTNGGGIDAPAAFAGSLALLNDTINGNFSDNGGGIFWAGTAESAVTVQNTIIAANTATATGPDAANPAGTFTDNGGNLIGIAGTGSGNTGFTAATTQTGTTATPLNPLLGALANNGGPTIGAPTATQTLTTEALLGGSPAIDKGVSAGAPTTDERGFTRPDTGTAEVPDVGAFEFQDTTLGVNVTPASSSVVQGTTASFIVTVTNTGGNALPANNSTVTVTLPAGLSATSPLTFTVGALAAGQKASFTVTATATAPGTQTVSAVVTNPDTTASASTSASVSVITAAPTTVTVTNVTSHYTLFTQVETVTASVTSNGTPVTTGQVTLTDGGQTKTVNVGDHGKATATFTFGLFSEQPLAHSVTAMYGGASGFASSSSTFTAPSTLFGYLFQLYFDYLILVSLGL